MNTPEVPGSDLSAQVAALRRQVFTLLLVLIVVSGTLGVYLYYQQRILGKEIAAFQPQAQQAIQAYKQNQPNMEHFVSELITYGNSHPDYRKQVLSKFPFTQPVPAATAPATPIKK